MGPQKGTIRSPRYDRVVSGFYEPQLERIDLAADQIAKQDLVQLEASLKTIDDAIENPGSFGTLWLNFSPGVGPIIAPPGSEAHFKASILLLLLERKDQILDRIRALRPEQEASELRGDVEAAVDDPLARDKLVETIDRRLEEQRAAREILDREQAQVTSARLEAKEREQRLQMEHLERKSAIYHSFLERESVASVVGAILLLTLAVTLIIGMFIHVAVSDVIANSFLLILGYFFGQATARDRKASSSEDSSI